ncbi:Short-chain dehydrogenase/reductase SDR [Penicillium cosmopolitanum]|uniref:Short-chain dehydrogenase/reductase SDR n=1 Tax=Penicillium cosmopolitanum TaxID=1131564 RepID=A0A9W9VGZ7_9EURO|nr:Short-chain dehydrogenase/reductase SDR [Penicillium cosmopolitanum]KAJ5379120.1 Short-chain dehydrogenase/reductase SDR [Penicillium cosmopolitanum]
MSGKQILRSEVILEKYGKKLAGKTVLITGVSDESIAGELALQLAAADPKMLILSARSGSKVAPVINQINAKNPNVQTRFLNMDLSDLSAVRKAATQDLVDISKIDHVVCVAGVMICPYGKTKDGFEMQLGVNYLANFLLIKLLLPKVEAAGPSSSVIIVSSSSIRHGKVHFDDIGFSEGKTYEAYAAYGQSNVARTMFAKKLAEKLKAKGIRVFSIDPGAVQSGLQRHFTEDFQAEVGEMMKTGHLVDLDGTKFDFPPWTGRSEGAASIITGMIDPTIADSSGAYISQNIVANDDLHSHIRDENNWTRLWEISEGFVGEKY